MSSIIVLSDLEQSGIASQVTRPDSSRFLNLALAPPTLSKGTVNPSSPGEAEKLRGGKALTLGLQLCLAIAANSLTNGLITIGVVDIAANLDLDRSLLYWPVLGYMLTSSPLLMPFGTLADFFGSRRLNLLGTLLCGVFIIACGLSRNGSELIAFRCLHGASSALVQPTAMSIISTKLATGRIRNVALACVSVGMGFGYGIGLVLGGVFLDTIGWRFGYYISGGLQVILFALGLWIIPSTPRPTQGRAGRSVLGALREEMDWVGALISCACIGMLSYVLAMIAQSVESIKQPTNISLLILSTLLIPTFVGWMGYQARRNRPALMPGSLWKPTFIVICIVVAFANAEMQCMELLASLFFQNIQELSPLQTSLRLLPGLFVAAGISLFSGSLVHKFVISWALAGSAILACISPLLMAIINPDLPYWQEAFPAQALYGICIDVVFVVSALVISDSFAEHEQALAGAVFNTVANLGQALGLALTAVVTNTVTMDHKDGEGGPAAQDTKSLLDGYRAGFWLSFAWMVLSGAIGAVGLRKVDKIGIKKD